jgi:hypothetical protein
MALPTPDPLIPANPDIAGGDIAGALDAWWGDLKPWLANWDTRLRQDMMGRPWFKAAVTQQTFQQSSDWATHGPLTDTQTNAADQVAFSADAVTLTAGLWVILMQFVGVQTPAPKTVAQLLVGAGSIASTGFQLPQDYPSSSLCGLTAASAGPVAWGLAPVWGAVVASGSLAGIRIA